MELWRGLLLCVGAVVFIRADFSNASAGCSIIRPPREGGIRYRGLTQEQIRSVQVLPVDYEIEYICRGNRIIVGPKVRKCLPNGTWTDMSHKSHCLLLCPRMWTSLENGRVTPWPPGPPAEGVRLHYSCLPGFILMGRNSTQCNKMGKWDSPKPVCHFDRHYRGGSGDAVCPDGTAAAGYVFDSWQKWHPVCLSGLSIEDIEDIYIFGFMVAGFLLGFGVGLIYRKVGGLPTQKIYERLSAENKESFRELTRVVVESAVGTQRVVVQIEHSLKDLGLRSMEGHKRLERLIEGLGPHGEHSH